MLHRRNVNEHDWFCGSFSTDHSAVPVKNRVRVQTFACLLMRTQFHNGKTAESADLTGHDVSTELTYTISVNPGGWAPVSVIRAFSKGDAQVPSGSGSASTGRDWLGQGPDRVDACSAMRLNCHDLSSMCSSASAQCLSVSNVAKLMPTATGPLIQLSERPR